MLNDANAVLALNQIGTVIISIMRDRWWCAAADVGRVLPQPARAGAGAGAAGEVQPPVPPPPPRRRVLLLLGHHIIIISYHTARSTTASVVASRRAYI